MSTKTTFKRVALVAAVAAALGGLSTVAANALVTAAASTVAQVAATGDNGSGGIAGPANTLQVVVTNAQTTATAHNLREYVTISGGTFVSSANGTLHTTIATTGLTAVQDVSGVSDTYTVNTPTAGSIVVNAYDETAVNSGLFASTASSTLTITVRTTGISGVLNLANSSAYLASQTHAATATYSSTDDSVNLDGTTAGKVAGEIQVTLKDGTGTSGAVLGATSLTASITGSGLLYGSTTNVTGTTQPGGARVAPATTGSGIAYFVVISDGTAGTGTVTIYDGSIVVATKTVTFSGAAAKVVASNNVNVVAASATSATAVELYVTDVNGNAVSGVATYISGTSANTAVVSTVGAAAADNSSTGGAGYYTASITAAGSATSGQSTTITYVVKDSSGNVIATAAPVTVAIGGTTIATIALSTDAASYTPGQKVTASLVAKDSSGNPVADGNYGIFFDNTLNTSASVTLSPVTASAQLTSAPFGIAVSSHEYYAFAKGVSTSTFYAPYTDGTVSLSSTLGATNSGLSSALQGTTLSASFSVTTGASDAANAATDAANEATDAANAATDAANAAADSADAATQAAQDAGDKADAALAAVTALSQQVTTLLAKVAAVSTALAKISAAIAKLPKK